MKIIKLTVFATIITIMIAAFTIPLVTSIVEEGGGGSSGPSGPAYLTYTNGGQTMARITPETTPTIDIAVTPTGVSVNGAEIEIAPGSIVAMAPGIFTASSPGAYIYLSESGLDIKATVGTAGSSTSQASNSTIKITAQDGQWHWLSYTLACTDLWIVAETGDYVNVPSGTAAYVPPDTKVTSAYRWGKSPQILNMAPADYVGYYKGTVEDVDGAVKVTLTTNDFGPMICLPVPKKVVTDIETEAPTPPADDNPVWNMVGIIPLVLLVGMVMIVVGEIAIGRRDD